jgi:hypothetical protein
LKQWHGKDKLTSVQVYTKLTARRARRHVAAPDLTNIRRVLRGETYRQGIVETRGRKKILSRRQVRSMNTKRKLLIKKAKGEHEVRWKDVIKETRGVTCSASTAKRGFDEAGLDVKWRRAREKPNKDVDVTNERLEICSQWQNLPANHFLKKVDLIIDNKKWPIPTTKQAKRYLKMQRLRGHLRTASEGLNPDFVKPSPRKRRKNPGGYVDLCAGICGDRVVLWEYLDGSWGGEAAAALYEGPVLSALRKHRGNKRRYTVLQDNDPRGYKSKLAQTAREENHIVTMNLPRYSPDLNPLDFGIWQAVQQRMDKQGLNGKESKEAFKARLRRTALRLSKDVVRQIALRLPRRIKAVVEAAGKDISLDWDPAEALVQPLVT